MDDAKQQFSHVGETFVNVLKWSNMLDQRPVGAPESVMRMWSKMKPLRVSQLLKYWALIEGDMSLFDIKHAAYDEWKDAYGWRFLGFKHKESGKQHGVARVV